MIRFIISLRITGRIFYIINRLARFHIKWFYYKIIKLFFIINWNLITYFISLFINNEKKIICNILVPNYKEN